MTNPWSNFPSNYRAREIGRIATATRAGECVSVIGLSGAGKSNLFGFLARCAPRPPRWQLVDVNRLTDRTPDGLLRLIALGVSGQPVTREGDAFDAAEQAVAMAVRDDGAPLALLLDRFDAFGPAEASTCASALRALRDAHKFRLALVLGGRRGLADGSELAELCYANTLVLGPLAASDVAWNIDAFAARRGLAWSDAQRKAITQHSGGYASLVRACCEAAADGAPPTAAGFAAHAAVRARVAEFWADAPEEAQLTAAGLTGIALLMDGRPAREAAASGFDATRLAALTAKESLLLNYLRAHPDLVCDKDDIIRAVWPEDVIYERGVRDDSLAQLVRRLREKVEVDPGAPKHILTVAGRGYRFKA